MKKSVSVECYIKENKTIILVPYKKCKYGFSLACEDWYEFNGSEWQEISKHIVAVLKRLCIEGSTEETKSEAFKNHGIKNFKKFSKQHICISIIYEYEMENVVIYHVPRLLDGSYGINSDQLELITEYHSGLDMEDIQNNFNKAYEDAKIFAKKA